MLRKHSLNLFNFHCCSCCIIEQLCV